MKNKLHKLLLRMLKRNKLDIETPPNEEQWKNFIEVLNKVLHDNDESRYLVERALAISSEEMKETLDKQKKLGSELAQTSKMMSIGTLASGIAHELNNPLAGIRGYAEILLSKYVENEYAKDRLSRIVALSDRMSSIVKLLLKLARKSDGNHSDEFSLNELIRDSQELAATHLKYENVAIQNNIKDDSIYVRGDRHGLISVLQNLINNACDEFMTKANSDDEPNIISIDLDEESNSKTQIAFKVTDNAGGIKKENLERIFDPFFTTKDVGQGTGLGLSLAQKLIFESKGEISVESENGKTTFLIKLRKGKSPEEGTANSIPNAFAKIDFISKIKKSMLIVDDEPDILEVMKYRLDATFDITTADSPIEAIQLIGERDFDIIMTDLKMPGLSGDAVIEYARSKNPGIACCVVSGHLQGASSILKKPEFENVIFIEKPIPKQSDLMKLINKAFGKVDSKNKKAA